MLTQSAQSSIPVGLTVCLVRAGLNQARLARRLGITKQYLGDILRMKRKALHIRERMVEEFGIPRRLVAWKSEDIAA